MRVPLLLVACPVVEAQIDVDLIPDGPSKKQRLKEYPRSAIDPSKTIQPVFSRPLHSNTQVALSLIVSLCVLSDPGDAGVSVWQL